MKQREPTTKVISRDEAQRQFTELLRQVAAGELRVTIEGESEPSVVMVAASDYQDDLDRRLFEIVGRAFEDQTPERIEHEVQQAIHQGRRRTREAETSSEE